MLIDKIYKSKINPISIIVLAAITSIIAIHSPYVHATCVTAPNGGTLCAGMSQTISITKSNTVKAITSSERPDVVIALNCELNGIRYGDYYNSCYQPPVLYIHPGTIVTWNNNDNASHSVTYGNRWDALSSGYFFNSNSIEPGQSFSYQFKYQGAYPYYDMFNWWETGLVIVKR